MQKPFSLPDLVNNFVSLKHFKWNHLCSSFWKLNSTSFCLQGHWKMLTICSTLKLKILDFLYHHLKYIMFFKINFNLDFSVDWEVFKEVIFLLLQLLFRYVGRTHSVSSGSQYLFKEFTSLGEIMKTLFTSS